MNEESYWAMSRDVAETEWAKKPILFLEFLFYAGITFAIIGEFFYLSMR